MLTHWSYVFLALTHRYVILQEVIDLTPAEVFLLYDVNVTTNGSGQASGNDTGSPHKLSVSTGPRDTWWRHQMETFSALLAFCAGNSPVTGEFSAQRPVTRSFDVFFDLRLNKRLSKQSWGWWFETPSRPLWRYRNGYNMNTVFPGIKDSYHKDETVLRTSYVYNGIPVLVKWHICTLNQHPRHYNTLADKLHFEIHFL